MKNNFLTRLMKIILIGTIVFFLAVVMTVQASDSVIPSPVEEGEKGKTNLSLSPVRFYQKFISPVLGGQCPMYPSCSKYCIDAVKKHGPLVGWVMTCDRLMRCGRDEVKRAPVIRTQNGKFSYDPVSENDFWRK